MFLCLPQENTLFDVLRRKVIGIVTFKNFWKRFGIDMATLAMPFNPIFLSFKVGPRRPLCKLITHWTKVLPLRLDPDAVAFGKCLQGFFIVNKKFYLHNADSISKKSAYGKPFNTPIPTENRSSTLLSSIPFKIPTKNRFKWSRA